MRAGRLNRRVLFQSKPTPTVPRDAFGGENLGWVDGVTVWGSVEPLQGREFIEGKQQDFEMTTRIRIRYRTDITNMMRAVVGAGGPSPHIYDIVDVQEPDMAHKELVLMCREFSVNG